MERDSVTIVGKDTSSILKTDSTAIAKADTTKQKIKKLPYIHQFRFGIDIGRFVFNQMYPSKQAYEFQADYALRNNLYLAGEVGFGNGKVDFDKLSYKTNASFIRLGLDKSFLNKISASDFDMGFLGFRYGMGIGQREDAEYLIISPFGTETNGIVPKQNFVVHWAEIIGGIKVELWEGVFAGWTGRGKFLLNGGVFKELAPNYIPGYGQGDKISIFNFNFYISYAIKWGKEEKGK